MGILSVLVLVRAQLGAIGATAVDFAVMMACASGLGWSPVVGTVVGASCGACSNFYLGRHWIFSATQGCGRRQAWRYTAVAGASLGWNALGEWWLTDRWHTPYLVARAGVAATVSLLWNYPLHKHYVFSRERS